MLENILANYSVQFAVKNRNLLGHIIGVEGEIRKRIEKENNVFIKMNGSTVHIMGKVWQVKAAERQIFDIFENQTYRATLTESLSRHIMEESLVDIREETGANIQIRNRNLEAGTRELEISGRTDSFKLAREKILDVIEVKVRENFKHKSNVRFRKRRISEGQQDVSFVKDQLPSNPLLFFLHFSDLENTEEFNPVESDSTNILPTNISEGSAVLAPYQNFLYRSKVVGIRRSSDKQFIFLKVIFVDFGNSELVNIFECRDIPNHLLFSPMATASKLFNLKSEAWKEELFTFFRRYSENGMIICRATVVEAGDASELISVKLNIPGLGNLAEALVANSFATWIDDPFQPSLFELSESRVGSSDLLYVSDGGGQSVRVDVTSAPRSADGEKVFICSNMKNETFSDSIHTALGKG